MASLACKSTGVPGFLFRADNNSSIMVSIQLSFAGGGMLPDYIRDSNNRKRFIFANNAALAAKYTV